MMSVTPLEFNKATCRRRSAKPGQLEETPAFAIGQQICFSILGKQFIGEVYLHLPPNFSVCEALQGVPTEDLFTEEDRSVFCRLLITIRRNGKTYWFAPLMVDCHPINDGGNHAGR